MLNVYLTDLEKTVELDLGRGKDDFKHIMALKKIFLSTADLLEPILPEQVSGKLDSAQIGWRTTQPDLDIFKKLASNWHMLELRLQAYAVFAGNEAMAIIVQGAQQQRQAWHKEKTSADHKLIDLDIGLLYVIHQQLDQLLRKEPPYADMFLQEWPEFKIPAVK
ncbi:hypothetical protein ACF3NA_03840 [Alkanindiges sp. WGS2144]|uniref:hypothetical protein n=1 Tax=Alkanindiges sp. WGS2144 TaxID=3366808 RepID=UPI003750765B